MFNRRVASAEWNPSAQLYSLVVADTDTGKYSVLETQIVISAVGIFGVPQCADIPGLADFKGDHFHSARWNYSKDLRDKRAGVISNGASSYYLFSSYYLPCIKLTQPHNRTQFVPVIVEDPTTQVVQFCRTQNWMFFDVSCLRFLYSWSGTLIIPLNTA